MGLDMYLYESKYLGHWSHQEGTSEYQAAETVVEAVGIANPLADEGGHVELKVCVMRWRKANQIHGWFVENVQGGLDECQASEVTIEALVELREQCKIALDSRDPGFLPPQSGFFFGSTEADEWYWKDIEETYKSLTTIVDRTQKHTQSVLDAGGSRWDSLVFFEYQASW